MTGVLISIVLLFLDVYAIIDVFKNVSAPVKKVLWILVIFMLPLIGPLAYCLFGRGGPLVGDRRVAR